MKRVGLHRPRLGPHLVLPATIDCGFGVKPLICPARRVIKVPLKNYSCHLDS